ncbi:MAG: elongation factor 4 [Chloroflexi bacterium]|nr:elongation factor 4 [Chloroflexota bacterium]
MDQERIRNFSIIAHIDHGKSTLADRMIELTGAMEARDMRAQVLDSMDLEREKGITIKAQAVRMAFTAADGETYQLNLIDTPGHVDFAYEVSRALAGGEGAVLVVDATQGIQAQTLATLYLAMNLDLEIVPVVNKVDLPSADPERVSKQIQDLIGFKADEVLFASGKSGIGVLDILEAVVKRVPHPKGDREAPLRAMVFDAKYDAFKGVVAYVRVFDGRVEDNSKLRLMQSTTRFEPVELGYFTPALTKVNSLDAGEVGYIATGLKGVSASRVGDTITSEIHGAESPLAGYEPAKAMVFAGIYPTDPDAYVALREALERLTLNDASLQWEPETSAALGFGFRCGFLGLLHMEIIQERLEREFDLDLIATAPSVEYEITKTNGDIVTIDSPAELPTSNEVAEIREPWVAVSITVPARHIGAVMGLVDERRGQFVKMEYLDHADDEGDSRVLASYKLPLAEILVEFYDQLKSRTSGFAAMDYQMEGYRAARVSRLDILVNGDPVDALSAIVPTEDAPSQGRKLVAALKELIPRQMFDVPIQAAIGGKVVARETVKAMRKNVLAKCYGGDITRKRKLLEKQKAGKKRMKMLGQVEVPQEAFMAVLKVRD